MNETRLVGRKLYVDSFWYALLWAVVFAATLVLLLGLKVWLYALLGGLGGFMVMFLLRITMAKGYQRSMRKG